MKTRNDLKNNQRIVNAANNKLSVKENFTNPPPELAPSETQMEHHAKQIEEQDKNKEKPIMFENIDLDKNIKAQSWATYTPD